MQNEIGGGRHRCNSKIATSKNRTVGLHGTVISEALFVKRS
jgi:hypothetical protein